MSAPVTADDLVAGCVRFLSGFSDVLAVLGSKAGAAFLFQNELWTPIESTGSTGAVISRAGSWAGANTHNTMRFPRLSLELYADPRRDAGLNPIEPGEVYRRIDAAYKAIDARLHRPQSGDQMWGSVRTIDCSRLAEPEPYPVPDGGGLLRMQVFYAVSQG